MTIVSVQRCRVRAARVSDKDRQLRRVDTLHWSCESRTAPDC
jgi:hypothetical protein